ncbi:MAG: DUF4810 domain-containing protein [Prevotellaceae bacterium]|jgi:hypothetical protein|nr:DUF4810 domain-containing protein [Prevotellaceae bacterium]
MKIIFLITFPVILLASCVTQKPLYTWDSYDVASYTYVKNGDERSIQELVKTYQKIIEKQKGSRGVPPPGICADYGFLLLQTDKVEEGKKMLKMEIAYYPESKVFIDRILKMLEK